MDNFLKKSLGVFLSQLLVFQNSAGAFFLSPYSEPSGPTQASYSLLEASKKFPSPILFLEQSPTFENYISFVSPGFLPFVQPFNDDKLDYNSLFAFSEEFNYPYQLVREYVAKNGFLLSSSADPYGSPDLEEVVAKGASRVEIPTNQNYLGPFQFLSTYIPSGQKMSSWTLENSTFRKLEFTHLNDKIVLYSYTNSTTTREVYLLNYFPSSGSEIYSYLYDNSHRTKDNYRLYRIKRSNLRVNNGYGSYDEEINYFDINVAHFPSMTFQQLDSKFTNLWKKITYQKITSDAFEMLVTGKIEKDGKEIEEKGHVFYSHIVSDKFGRWHYYQEAGYIPDLYTLKSAVAVKELSPLEKLVFTFPVDGLYPDLDNPKNVSYVMSYKDWGVVWNVELPKNRGGLFYTGTGYDYATCSRVRLGAVLNPAMEENKFNFQLLKNDASWDVKVNANKNNTKLVLSTYKSQTNGSSSSTSTYTYKYELQAPYRDIIKGIIIDLLTYLNARNATSLENFFQNLTPDNVLQRLKINSPQIGKGTTEITYDQNGINKKIITEENEERAYKYEEDKSSVIVSETNRKDRQKSWLLNFSKTPRTGALSVGGETKNFEPAKGFDGYKIKARDYVSLAILDPNIPELLSEKFKIKKEGSYYIVYQPYYFASSFLQGFLKHFGYSLRDLEQKKSLQIFDPIEKISELAANSPTANSGSGAGMLSSLKSMWENIEKLLINEAQRLGLIYNKDGKIITIQIPQNFEFQYPYKKLRVERIINPLQGFKIVEFDPRSNARLNTIFFKYKNGQPLPPDAELLDFLLDWVISEESNDGKSTTAPNPYIDHKLVYDHFLRLRQITVYDASPHASKYYYPLPPDLGEALNDNFKNFPNFADVSANQISNDIQHPPSDALVFGLVDQDMGWPVLQTPSGFPNPPSLAQANVVSEVNGFVGGLNIESLFSDPSKIVAVSLNGIPGIAVERGNYKYIYIEIKGKTLIITDKTTYTPLLTIFTPEEKNWSIITYYKDKGVADLIVNQDLFVGTIPSISPTKFYAKAYPNEDGYFRSATGPSFSEKISTAKSALFEEFFKNIERYIIYFTTYKVSTQIVEKQNQSSQFGGLKQAQLKWVMPPPFSNTLDSFLSLIFQGFGAANNGVMNLVASVSNAPSSSPSGTIMTVSFSDLHTFDSFIGYDFTTGAGVLDWQKKFIFRSGSGSFITEQVFKTWARHMLKNIVDESKLESEVNRAFTIAQRNINNYSSLINELRKDNILKYLVFPGPEDDWHPREGQLSLEIKNLYITWAHIGMLALFGASYGLPYIGQLSRAIPVLQGIITRLSSSPKFLQILASLFGRALINGIRLTAFFNVGVTPFMMLGQTGRLDWVELWNDMPYQYFSNLLYTTLFGLAFTPYQLGLDKGLPTFIHYIFGKFALPGRIFGELLTLGDRFSRWFIGPQGSKLYLARWALYNYIMEGVMEEGVLPLAMETQFKDWVPKNAPPGFPQTLATIALLNLRNTETYGSLAEMLNPIENPFAFFLLPAIMKSVFKDKPSVKDAILDAFLFKNPML